MRPYGNDERKQVYLFSNTHTTRVLPETGEGVHTDKKCIKSIRKKIKDGRFSRPQATCGNDTRGTVYNAIAAAGLNHSLYHTHTHTYAHTHTHTYTYTYKHTQENAIFEKFNVRWYVQLRRKSHSDCQKN